MRCIEQGMGEGTRVSVHSLDMPLFQYLDVFTNPDALQTPLFRVSVEVHYLGMIDSIIDHW